MTRIIVIEPQADLCQSLVLALSRSLRAELVQCQCQIHSSCGTYSRTCELAILSICSHTQTDQQIEATLDTYEPRSILLSADAYDRVGPSITARYPSVRGLIMKDATPELHVAAARLVLAGGTCFPSYVGHDSESPPQEESTKLGLTPRQYEVLVLLARGYPLKTVARTLDISVATAKAHTEAVYQRLEVHNRNAAVFRALKLGATLGLNDS